MTQHDKAPELVERLKVVARCGTDSTMRHSAYAFRAQDPDGDYVTYCAYAALSDENRRLREALQPFAAIADLFDSEVEGHADTDELSLFYGDDVNWLADRFTLAQFNAARAALVGGRGR